VAGRLDPYLQSKIKSQTDDRKVLLVGDAATQVKATTAGGIIQAMTAAGFAAESIIKGTDYEKAWKKTLGKELWMHLMLRNALDNFTDKDYNDLIKKMNLKKSKKCLRKKAGTGLCH